MKERKTHFLVVFLVIGMMGVAAWPIIHFRAVKQPGLNQTPDNVSNPIRSSDADLWTQGVEKVKADRGEPAGGVVIPPELRHYSDRHWFLATQVAEIRKFNVQTCQDFVDLAAMIERGEMVGLPAATEDYILFGVGARADDDVFIRYEDDHSIRLYTEAQLREEYGRLDAKRFTLQTEIAKLKAQLSALKRRNRTKQAELQKEITARQQELKSSDEDKALLDRFYGSTDSRQNLFRDYESLRTLAKNFGGRSYNLDDSSDRQAMKVNMLRSLRPEALKVMEQVATDYHRKFDRPLPVSSLVRPEQYQHALNKVNSNAVMIETPPHSTGLAFDIDYRYMSAGEQSFLMAELARLKVEGRIEVIRERSANYHVFVFIDGTRPSDELITASLDEASVKEAHHARKEGARVKRKSQRVKHTNVRPRARKRR